MRNPFLRLLFVITLTLGLLSAPLRAEDETTAPVPALALAFDKPGYQVGDVMQITVTLTNSSAEAKEFVELDLDRQSLSLQVKAPGGTAGTWTRIHANETLQGILLKQYEMKTLQPGEAATFSIAVPALLAGEWEWSASYIGHSEGREKPLTSETLKVAVTAKDGADKAMVKMTTSAGDIFIELLPQETPGTALNFASSVAEKKYDGLLFHRVIAGFMIQGGDPKGDGTGGFGYFIPFEAPKTKHTPGVLSMARMPDKDTGGSQFFLMHEASTHLDDQYCAFGKTIKGQDVINAIATTQTGEMDRPIVDQKILSATMHTGKP